MTGSPCGGGTPPPHHHHHLPNLTWCRWPSTWRSPPRCLGSPRPPGTRPQTGGWGHGRPGAAPRRPGDMGDAVRGGGGHMHTGTHTTPWPLGRRLALGGVSQQTQEHGQHRGWGDPSSWGAEGARGGHLRPWGDRQHEGGGGVTLGIGDSLVGGVTPIPGAQPVWGGVTTLVPGSLPGWGGGSRIVWGVVTPGLEDSLGGVSPQFQEHQGKESPQALGTS